MNLETALERSDILRHMNSTALDERRRIRHIMNGGADGIQAVMAWDYGKGSSSSGPGKGGNQLSKLGVDLPTVNLVASGLDRLAQIVGRAPTLKTPAALDDKLRAKSQKRIDIVQGWDDMQRVELQFPQIGRWLPGYGQIMWVIRQRRTPDGTPFPVAELRDPYDVYPGWFGADQQPEEAAIVRIVPWKSLEQAYPEQNWTAIKQKCEDRRKTASADRMQAWEGYQEGVEVVEYMCSDGTWIIIPEAEHKVARIPNPLNGPAFVFAKRYSFDRSIGQYHHVIGLMAMLAKMNVLGLIAAEDSVFKETNIYGELQGNTYQRGRFAVNEFAPGSRVEKPTGDQQQQVWAQIDRLERQMRIGAAYDVQQDAISPNSFATGQGMRELQGAANANVREYQTVIRHGMERNDAKRLEWAETMYADAKRKIYLMGGPSKEYRASRDIKGDYRTERVFGAMATFDDAQKVVIGLQLLQAGAIDLETLQENIDGLSNINLINQRNDAKLAKETMFGMLSEAGQQDPRAKAAMVEIMENPEKISEILKKYFTPQEPEMSPEEQQMMGMGDIMGGGMAGGGMPPDVTSVLSRMEMGGGVEGGVQTVGQL